jgi:hypothetical protein
MQASHHGRHGRSHGHFAIALTLAAGLFLLHAILLIEVADVLPHLFRWLRESHSPLRAGETVLLACFVILFVAHFAEAAAWGLYFWRSGFVGTFADGVYFAAASITSVGYGDLVLPAPWRLLGPSASINGTRMFGCSTAFLFLVLQQIWAHQG